MFSYNYGYGNSFGSYGDGYGSMGGGFGGGGQTIVVERVYVSSFR